MTLAGATQQDAAKIEAALREYEGLIFSTARLIVRAGVEQEMEDIQQILRVKAWRAISAFNPEKSRGMNRDRYVFMCVTDAKKDLLKRKRRGELHIEDIAPARVDDIGGGGGPRDSFEERYLSADHETVYGGVDEGDVLLPNTLSERELAVLELMREHYRQTEIAIELRITKREVESAVRGIRSKLADWRPASEQAVVPVA